MFYFRFKALNLDQDKDGMCLENPTPPSPTSSSSSSSYYYYYYYYFYYFLTPLLYSS